MEMYMIPVVLIVGLFGMIPVFFPQDKRAEPVKNHTKVNTAIEIGYFMWRINMFLPSTNFVSNMKRAVIRNTDTLKIHWKQNKNVFEKFYHTIPLELRKKFISDLTKEMKESLECYFEKDEFHMSIISEFNPQFLICEEDDRVKSMNDRDNGDNRDATATAPVATKSQNSKFKKDKNKSKSQSKSKSPDHMDIDMDLDIFSVDRLFDETSDVIDKLTVIKVMSAYETEGDLDPTLAVPLGDGKSGSDSGSMPETIKNGSSSGKGKGKEDTVLNNRIVDFLHTLRALAVVMFLHQFLKRYPVDAKADPYVGTFLYKYLGERTGKLIEALKMSGGIGCVVLIVMLALQHSGVLDEVFWGMESIPEAPSL